MYRIALISLVLFWAQNAMAYKVYRTDKGTPLRWYKSEVKMFYDYNGTRDIPGNAEWQAVNKSMDTWNAVDCNQPTLEPGGLKQDGKSGYWPHKDNYNLIRWVNNKDEWTQKYVGNEDVIAFTTVSFDLNTGEIYDADMDINDWNFNFGVDGSPSKYDVQNTVTHELGHVLGMDHSKDPTATMYYSANKGDINKRTLAQDDKDGLCYLYSRDWAHPDGGGGDIGRSDTGQSTGHGGCTQGTKGGLKAALLLVLLVLSLIRTRKVR